MKTIIFTDGSSRGNPGHGGWGTVVISNGKVTEFGGREEMTTNNRMELMASIRGIKALETADFFRPEDSIIVYSDSQYVIKGITEWIHGWVKKGWRNSQKKEVLNRDLWEDLLKACQDKKIVWEYVKGHDDNAGNIRCDEIATRFADGEKMALYKGIREKYPFVDILENT